MMLLRLFSRYVGQAAWVLAGTTTLAGILTALVVVVISRATAEGTAYETKGLAIAFLVLLALMYQVRRYASRGTIDAFEDVQLGLRQELAQALARAPLRVLEEREALEAAVTDEIIHLSNTVRAWVYSLQHVVLIVSCGVIISFLSMKAMLIWVFCIAAVALVMWADRSSARSLFHSADTHSRELHGKISDLLYAAKQIKLDTALGDEMLGQIRVLARDRYALGARAVISSRRVSTNAVAAFFIAGSGVAAFTSADGLGVGPEIGYQLVAMFAIAMDPVLGLLEDLEVLRHANAAAGRLLATLEALKPESMGASHRAYPIKFANIQFMGVTFHYQSTKGPGVGPINFEITPGQLILVTGGNGSGKTTLIKLLTGLYTPDEGALCLDGIPVGPDAMESYRSLFTGIFSDQHLFRRLYGLYGVDPATVQEGLVRFGIEDVTRFDGESFSSLDLSSGQRMRLAMVVALLEKRPICVFDEWTACQDPAMTRYYYDVVLPTLVREGKTVIAISHDHRFFDRADLLLRMENGHLHILHQGARS